MCALCSRWRARLLSRALRDCGRHRKAGKQAPAAATTAHKRAHPLLRVAAWIALTSLIDHQDNEATNAAMLTLTRGASVEPVGAFSAERRVSASRWAPIRIATGRLRRAACLRS